MARSRLLPSLLKELFQAERSAYRHPIREAERLGDVPPSVALRAVAAHANEALDDLPKLARARGVRLTQIGDLAGDVASFVRGALVDRVVDLERSYRGTLLGMRHGIDLVRLLRAAAEDEGDAGMATWCDRWLPVRETLVRGVASELAWLAHHPVFSSQRAAPLFGLVHARSGA